jgi:hypothetical protein
VRCTYLLQVTMADITKWTLFSLLDTEFIERIKFALVFGSAGNEALIVADDDRVYGLGTNACSCLGQCPPAPFHLELCLMYTCRVSRPWCCTHNTHVFTVQVFAIVSAYR